MQTFGLKKPLFAPQKVAFKIMVPSDGSKPEWNLNGQVLDMTLSLRDPVSAIKAKIAEDTGMPPGKQKLRMETIFFKDSNRSGQDTIF